jgi:hypothetical protein
MRDMKRIEIKVDETKQLERIKKSLQRLKEETKECGHAVCGCGEGREHTPAEKKFLNKLTVGVCVIAALIMYAAYRLFPIIN